MVDIYFFERFLAFVGYLTGEFSMEPLLVGCILKAATTNIFSRKRLKLDQICKGLKVLETAYRLKE